MGDGRRFFRDDNRCCPQSLREERTVLEWKPRVIGLVLLLILIGVVTGVLVPDDPGPLNWEW
jgi:hypothetical protein